ncbi:hypothetical protein SDC9_147796 [bioreactor metagenome]|uniref:GntR C-terminal domain-containing protein n=1 Tax=bioreactor metagenome TaxID=1076179 RepID=A0A645EH00_9ZZZZ
MELLALDLAISRGTDEEIELVQTAMDDLRASVLSGKPWATAGTSFHTRIAEMSGNVLLLKFVDSLAYSIGKYKDFLIEANTSMDRHIADHQAILDALRNRDREAGEIAVRRHMISTEEDIKRLVNENSATHFVIR